MAVAPRVVRQLIQLLEVQFIMAAVVVEVLVTTYTTPEVENLELLAAEQIAAVVEQITNMAEMAQRLMAHQEAVMDLQTLAAAVVVEVHVMHSLRQIQISLQVS